MRDKYVFSDAQALSTLDSTGEVSDNVFDMELDSSGGDTILTDDHVDAYLNLLITATTNTAGDEGIEIELRASDSSNMSSSPEYLGSIILLQSEIAAGKKYSIRVNKTLSKKFLGVWYKATSTSLDNATAVDCWMSATPVGENEDIQKTSQQY